MKYNAIHRLTIKYLLAVLFVLLATTVSASENTTTEKSEPPGILNGNKVISLSALETVKSIAKTLSESKGWQTKATIRRLKDKSLQLNELYSSVPRVYEYEGLNYEITLELISEGNAIYSDNALVFISQEVYSELGEDVAIGYENGEQVIVTDFDVLSQKSFALTVKEIDSEKLLSLNNETKPVQLSEPISLKKFSPRAEKITPANKQQIVELIAGGPITRTACTHQVTLSQCQGGVPVCSNGTSPFFVGTGIKIFEDNEGFLKGNPEIELFTLNEDVPGALPEQGDETTLIFDGRNVVDAAGRTRYLPDVNNVNSFYSMANGLAILPYQLGSDWIMALVEQDDDVGVLKSNNTNRTVLEFELEYNPQTRSVEFNFLSFLKNIAVAIIKGVVFGGDGDDIFDAPISVGNSLACNDGVGGSSMLLTTNEWEMNGYYTCLNPSCAPVEIEVQGPTLVVQGYPYTWNIDFNSGTPPYTYQWKKNNVNVGTGSSYTTSGFQTFQLSVTVTDATGQSSTDAIWVVVDDLNCGPFEESCL